MTSCVRKDEKHWCPEHRALSFSGSFMWKSLERAPSFQTGDVMAPLLRQREERGIPTHLFDLQML